MTFVHCSGFGISWKESCHWSAWLGVHTQMQSIETHLSPPFREWVIVLYHWCFVIFTFTDWSLDHESLHIWKPIRIQLELVEIIIFCIHLGHRRDWGILISFDVKKKTGHFTWKKEQDENEMKSEIHILFITTVNQLLDTVCQLCGTFSGALSPDAARQKWLQHLAAADWNCDTLLPWRQAWNTEWASEHSSKEIFSLRPFNFD